MVLQERYRPALLAAVMALALYAVTLKGTYIEDDLIIVRDDPRLFAPGQWPRLLREEYWPDGGSVDNLYRPLVSLSYALQWHLIGHPTPPPQSATNSMVEPYSDAGAFSFHLVNWLLNGIVAAMVAELARRLTAPAGGHKGGREGALGPAYLAGVLFAVHPIHVEAVAGLVGRAESMCAIGMLGALILAMHRPMTIARAVAITACVAGAIFSKEQGMLVPLLLLMLPFCLGVDPPRSERERRAVVWLVLMASWFTASYIVLREHYFKFEWDTYFLDFSQQPMVRSHGRDRLLMPLVLLGHYAQLLVLPIHQSLDYGGAVIGWVVRFNDPYLYLGIAVTLAYLGVLAALMLQPRPTRPTRAAIFCLLAAGVLYGMVGNIVSLIATNFGERLMYLPSAFLCIAAAIGLMRLPKPVILAFSIVAILFGSFRTISYAHLWNDRLHFYEIASAQEPKSVRLHMLVAVECLSEGKLDEAKAAARAGRESLPDYTEVWIQSAQIAMAQGQFDEAEHYLGHAMSIAPSVKINGWQSKLAAMRSAAHNP
jgi:hypothetical protein